MRISTSIFNVVQFSIISFKLRLLLLGIWDDVIAVVDVGRTSLFDNNSDTDDVDVAIVTPANHCYLIAQKLDETQKPTHTNKQTTATLLICGAW
jgi:hypothetical protein